MILRILSSIVQVVRPVPVGFNFSLWQQQLSNYFDAEYILTGIRDGFHIGMLDNPPTPTSLNNPVLPTSLHVSKHLTFYLQPQKEINNGLKVFGTLGLVRADVESKVQSVSSTDKTVDQSLDGMKLGLGLKKETGFGFIKLEYSQTDYDDISATTSNNTKVTADIDTNILALSFARNF